MPGRAPLSSADPSKWQRSPLLSAPSNFRVRTPQPFRVRCGCKGVEAAAHAVVSAVRTAACRLAALARDRSTAREATGQSFATPVLDEAGGTKDEPAGRPGSKITA
eukprot:SAG31_NODE_1820_length_7198_cov_3.163122_3_plen_106_part_00